LQANARLPAQNLAEAQQQLGILQAKKTARMAGISPEVGSTSELIEMPVRRS
jgi:hypothetical protein